jgi:hypothetical protein
MSSLCGLVAIAGCLARDREPPQVTYSPNEPQEIVVVFDSGITQADVNKFNLEELHRYESGRGYESRFPLQMVALARGADERPLLVLRLQPDATPDQRKSLDSALRASRIVNRVLHDTAPASVGRIK